MKTWVILCWCALLTACATVVTVPPAETVLNDKLFTPPTARIDAADVFALSDEMRHYLDNDIAKYVRTKGTTHALVDALYSKQQLQLEYESAMTRNAAQAFASRSGNCLSLVIMTAAFAKQMGINVEFQSVFIDETWSRKGNINFLSGHVDLSLRRPAVDSQYGPMDNSSLIVDFLPSDDVQAYRRQTITEKTIIAMYMNNRAAESLAVDQVNDAYWWAREAILQAPTFLSAYNTLGVIYESHGNRKEAEQVFSMILEREPDNLAALSNQARLLAKLGRTAEAAALNARLTKIEPYPPFYFFDRGMLAMRAGDFQKAKEMFSKEVNRAAYYHEFQFWLGIADLRLGDMTEARKHIAMALENGPTIADRDLYSAKLEQLKMSKSYRQN
ncbi:tetratricopeptide repeat protein [Undibacterium sp.]|jgi:Flp pilus assembly protein TadD|uniref:tetratricopeptide repeat protein n=1 Tax=Undibacterium sp. TaxID=1914977 RepID=UPI002CD46193|nr:tetratricopeptide repeat protein [Undibacterium sp.]HTD03861.1 tetratricopeptide repeat protein [Undibacterium sp.]